MPQRLLHSDNEVGEVTRPTGASVASERGQELEAAREQDSAWRDSRQKRTRSALRNAEFASDIVLTGLGRVAKALGVVFISNGLVIAGYALAGANTVPVGIQIALIASILGLIVLGLLALVSHALGWGVSTGVRGWAERNAVDLRTPPADAAGPWIDE